MYFAQGYIRIQVVKLSKCRNPRWQLLQDRGKIKKTNLIVKFIKNMILTWMYKVLDTDI